MSLLAIWLSTEHPAFGQDSDFSEKYCRQFKATWMTFRTFLEPFDRTGLQRFGIHHYKCRKLLRFCLQLLPHSVTLKIAFKILYIRVRSNLIG